MYDTYQDETTLSMKVFKKLRQIEREKTKTIWDRIDRLQHNLKPLWRGKQIKKGVTSCPKNWHREILTKEIFLKFVNLSTSIAQNFLWLVAWT